jgi:hypothetical protein
LGRYLLWDQRESRVQLTHISYDPYNDDKILVGTRDAGVICSRDGGVTWRTIKGTEPIRYITGFQFRQDGGVLVSTYGRGLWRIKRSRAACTQGRVWVIELPEPPRELVPWREYRTGQLVLPEPDDDAGEVPSGRDLEGVPILSGTGGGTGAEELILGDDNQLTIVGRGFSYDLGAPLLAYLDGAPEPFLKLGIPSSNGRFALRIQLPADLAPGEHRLELVQHSGEPPIRASIWFRKVHLDEHLGEEAPESQFRDENAWEDALRKVLERDPEYKQKQSLR